MTITIDHALRARAALVFSVQHSIREHLRYRKGRGKLPGYAASCLLEAKRNGRSANFFFHLIQTDIANTLKK